MVMIEEDIINHPCSSSNFIFTMFFPHFALAISLPQPTISQMTASLLLTLAKNTDAELWFQKKSVLITMIMIDDSQKVQISLMLLLIINSKKYVYVCVWYFVCTNEIQIGLLGCWCWWWWILNRTCITYLIIVADAADAVSVNYSGRCKFLQI